MKTKITILILCAAFLSNAWSQECSSIDLRGDKLGVVRNQDSMGWCFAFAAADILSYRLAQRISAADLAHQRLNGPPDQFEIAKKGYNPANAVRETRKRGWCLEKDMPSEDNVFGIYFELFKKISELKKQMASGSGLNEEEACEILQDAFPNLDKETALTVLRESSLKEYYTHFANENCSSRVKDPTVTIQEIKKKNGGNILKALNKQLEAKNVAAINYNAGIFTNPNLKDDTVTHSSLIVARRYNKDTKNCEYLIRNSWGRSCGYYPKHDCEEGHIWMPAPSLVNTTSEVYYAQ